MRCGSLLRQWNLWLIPYCYGKFFACGCLVCHEVHLQIHILFVELYNDPILHYLLMPGGINEIPCCSMRFAFHSYHEEVVMRVPQVIGTLAADNHVLLIAELRAEHSVRGTVLLSSRQAGHIR